MNIQNWLTVLGLLFAGTIVLAWLSGYHRRMNLYSSCSNDPDPRSRWIHFGFALCAVAFVSTALVALSHRSSEATTFEKKVERLGLALQKEIRRGEKLEAENASLLQLAKINFLAIKESEVLSIQAQEELLAIIRDMQESKTRLKALCDFHHNSYADLWQKNTKVQEDLKEVIDVLRELHEENEALHEQNDALRNFITGDEQNIPTRDPLTVSGKISL